MRWDVEKRALSKLENIFDFGQPKLKDTKIELLEFRKLSREEKYRLDGYALAIYPLLFGIMESSFKKIIYFVFEEIRGEINFDFSSQHSNFIDLFFEKKQDITNILQNSRVTLNLKEKDNLFEQQAIKNLNLYKGFDQTMGYFNKYFSFNLFDKYSQKRGRTTFKHLVTSRNNIAHGTIFEMSYEDELSNIRDTFNFIDELIKNIEAVQYDYNIQNLFSD